MENIESDLIFHMEDIEKDLILGRAALELEMRVVMVRTVVMPSATRAGEASRWSQKEIQDSTTMSAEGTYMWMM